MLSFAQHEEKTKGRAYLMVLVDSEGAEEDLGTWRVARQLRPPSRRRRRRHEREEVGRESAARTLGNGRRKGRVAGFAANRQVRSV